MLTHFKEKLLYPNTLKCIYIMHNANSGDHAP